MQTIFMGSPVSLLGRQLAPGAPMPDFTVTDGFASVSFSSTSGVRVFAALPAVDMPVCGAEIHTLAAMAADEREVAVWVVSADSPFAQQRWLRGAGVEALRLVSDYQGLSFGRATGTLMEHSGLLTRAVFVVNGAGVVTYAEYVPQNASPPDYAALSRAMHNTLVQSF